MQKKNIRNTSPKWYTNENKIWNCRKRKALCHPPTQRIALTIYLNDI